MTFNFQIEPPPENLRSPLLQMRDYYALLAEEYERKSSAARLQLARVEALLSNWSNRDHNQTTSTPVVAESLFNPDENGFSDNDLLQAIESQSLPNDSQIDVVNQTPPADITSPPTPVESNDSHRVAEVPMLPQYQGINRTQAIERLLQEHKGSVCHIDFVVRSLYGDLEPYVFKVVKGRVQSSLTHGRERKLWFAIPDSPGCFTLDLSLVEPQNAVSSKTLKRKPKGAPIPPKAERVPMLPEFAGQFLIDAIATFFRQNSGKIFSVDQVIAGVYGDVDQPYFKDIKNAVHNELSRGHRIGRFSRVPNKIGFYTWDLQALQNSSLNETMAS